MTDLRSSGCTIECPLRDDNAVGSNTYRSGQVVAKKAIGTAFMCAAAQANPENPSRYDLPKTFGGRGPMTDQKITELHLGGIAQ
jgi:hypothetical protein